VLDASVSQSAPKVPQGGNGMSYLLPVAAGIVTLVLIAMLAGAVRRGPGLLSDPERGSERRQLRQLAVLLILMVVVLSLTPR